MQKRLILPALVIAAAVASLATSVTSAQEVQKPAEPLRLEEILPADSIAAIAARRATSGFAPGFSYRFTFKDVPGYGTVEVHYLIEEKVEAGHASRRLADHPSAVVYLVQANRTSEMRKHLSEAEFADVLEQILAVEKAGDTVKSVTIRRGLFDIGDAAPADFLKNRQPYYDSAKGQPFFDKWPAEYRKPSGRLTASVVSTSIFRSGEKSQEQKTIYAKQFFGYLFPVVDDLLSATDKARIASELRQSNVREGAGAVALENVPEFGTVTLYYLVKEGKPLPRPTAMAVHVTLTAQQIAQDPLIVRKHLAPEGATYLMNQIHTGEKAGQRLKSVEITRMMLDVTEKGTPEGTAVHAEFKKDITAYCRQDALVGPETWPDRFRHPDGKFDVELTSTRITWVVTKRQ